MSSFGNHKGAQARSNELADLVEKDVQFGYALPLPVRVAKALPGILFAPMNIMDQNSIDDCGRIIEKSRLTHDQSYVFSGSKTSVNSRVCKETTVALHVRCKLETIDKLGSNSTKAVSGCPHICQQG